VKHEHTSPDEPSAITATLGDYALFTRSQRPASARRWRKVAWSLRPAAPWASTATAFMSILRTDPLFAAVCDAARFQARLPTPPDSTPTCGKGVGFRLWLPIALACAWARTRWGATFGTFRRTRESSPRRGEGRGEGGSTSVVIRNRRTPHLDPLPAGERRKAPGLGGSIRDPPYLLHTKTRRSTKVTKTDCGAFVASPPSFVVFV
jgi:hypothetical protein